MNSSPMQSPERKIAQENLSTASDLDSNTDQKELWKTEKSAEKLNLSRMNSNDF